MEKCVRQNEKLIMRIMNYLDRNEFYFAIYILVPRATTLGNFWRRNPYCPTFGSIFQSFP